MTLINETIGGAVGGGGSFQQLSYAFKVFDINDDGVIGAEDIRDVVDLMVDNENKLSNEDKDKVFFFFCLPDDNKWHLLPIRCFVFFLQKNEVDVFLSFQT